MPRSRRRAAANGPRSSIYEELTARVVAELEAGRVPWVQPWDSAAARVGMPRNAASGRRYSGINILILWDAIVRRGFAGHAFLTYRQAAALGACVRRGERGTTVVYAGRFVPGETHRDRTRVEKEKVREIPFLRRFTVFATDQCDGLPDEIARPAPPLPDGMIVPRAAALIRATRADFRIGGPMACYDPARDIVCVPRPEAFHHPVDWHRTAFHELGHWTGHPTRLGRDQTGTFGSNAYGREELVAELAGAFVCAALGIEPTVRHCNYLGSWLAIMREDSRAIVRAASAASRAADYLLECEPDAETCEADIAAGVGDCANSGQDGRAAA